MIPSETIINTTKHRGGVSYGSVKSSIAGEFRGTSKQAAACLASAIDLRLKLAGREEKRTVDVVTATATAAPSSLHGYSLLLPPHCHSITLPASVNQWATRQNNGRLWTEGRVLEWQQVT